MTSDDICAMRITKIINEPSLARMLRAISYRALTLIFYLENVFLMYHHIILIKQSVIKENYKFEIRHFFFSKKMYYVTLSATGVNKI